MRRRHSTVGSRRLFEVVRGHAVCHGCGYVRYLSGRPPFEKDEVKRLNLSALQHAQDHDGHDVRVFYERAYRIAGAAARRFIPRGEYRLEAGGRA